MKCISKKEYASFWLDKGVLSSKESHVDDDKDEANDDEVDENGVDHKKHL